MEITDLSHICFLSPWLVIGMTIWSLNEQVGASHGFKFGKPLGWGHYDG